MASENPPSFIVSVNYSIVEGGRANAETFKAQSGCEERARARAGILVRDTKKISTFMDIGCLRFLVARFSLFLYTVCSPAVLDVVCRRVSSTSPYSLFLFFSLFTTFLRGMHEQRNYAFSIYLGQSIYNLTSV